MGDAVYRGLGRRIAAQHQWQEDVTRYGHSNGFADRRVHVGISYFDAGMVDARRGVRVGDDAVGSDDVVVAVAKVPPVL